MLPSGILVGEPWRYEAIDRGSRIPRPEGHFLAGQYVVCRIDGDYIAGRLLDVSGWYPPILKICMEQGRFGCSAGIDECESNCRFRVLTTADNSAVLGIGDLDPFIVAEPMLLAKSPLFGIIDSRKAEELFDLIMKLERRQNIC